MEIVLVILGVLFILRPIVGECVGESTSEKKYLKYLEHLKGQSLKVTDNQKNYTYDIKFCEAVAGTKDVGVIQRSLQKESEPVAIGRITAIDIKSGIDWILLTYKNGQVYGRHCGLEARQAHIMMLCDTKNLIGTVAVVEENNEKAKDCSYIFEMSTSVACTSSPVSPFPGLSIGSALVIIGVSVILAYIIFGFIFQRFFIGAKGIEQFPNVSFWRDFGNLVADGCNLVFRTKPPQESRSYKGLGDDQLGFDEDEERDDHMLPM